MTQRLLNELYFVLLFRNRSLGFTVIIDARKTTTKRKYLEEIVEAMVCFQVCNMLFLGVYSCVT